MLTVRDIKALPFEVPLKQSLKWGRSDELRALEHVLIRVELSDGSIGIAEATPRPSIYGETQASIVAIVESHLAPLLEGAALDSFQCVADISARMDLIKNNNTAKGAADMALHQALCRATGTTLAGHLGAARERIRLSYIVSTGEADAVLADVEGAYRFGLRVFKVKIGKDIAAETETIRELVKRFPGAQFYVDANQTLDEDGAPGILNALYDLGLIYCEEALPVERIRARRALRGESRMPIVADDSAFTPQDLGRELAFDTFDILNIKTARTGFSQSMTMKEISAQAGKGLMVGSQASSLLGCLHAAAFAAQTAVNCASECSFFLKTDADLSLAPTIKDGWLSLTEAESALEGLINASI
ncbi:MAG: enolase [Chloroflexi bacterium]|nr:enolase [Chloroflexota bacterium]